MDFKKIFKQISRKIICAATALFFALPNSKSFAIPNEYGDPSFANSALNLNVPARLRISDLNDMTFDMSSYNGIGRLTVTDQLCVYANTVGYDVAALSDNGIGNRFRLKSGNTFLIYDIRWNGVNLDHNANPKGDFTDHSTNSISCNGETNTTLQLRIGKNHLVSAPTLTTPYTDILTITVSPS